MYSGQKASWRFRMESLESRTLLAGSGTLDPSFNGTGIASASFGAGVTATAFSAKVDAAGRTVVVGEAGKDFAIARFKVDGTLDNTFGPNLNGTVLVHVGLSGDKSGARDLAIQPDGKIVVVGFGNGDANGPISAVLRLTSSGHVDSAFGNIYGLPTYGSFVFSFGDNDRTSSLKSVVLQADGKIVVAGTTFYGGYTGAVNNDFGIARFTSDGKFDSTFHNDGRAVVGLGDFETVASMGIDASNRILVAGTKSNIDGSSNVTALVRLTPTGSIDNSFDGDGNAQVSYQNNRKTQIAGMVIQNDGKIVLGGTYNKLDFVSVRFNSTGPIDTTFGNAAGWNLTDFGGIEVAKGMMKTDNNGFLLSGLSTTGQVGQPTTTRTALAEYNTNGSLNTNFDFDGKATISANVAGTMATGGGRRFVMAAGSGFRTARVFDVGANLVYATAFLDPRASETNIGQSPDPASFFVYRSERLPYVTRVYFSRTGTANHPTNIIIKTDDYRVEGIVIPPSTAADPRPYVDIAANQTYNVVYIYPVNNTIAEPTETVNFQVLANSAYEVGSPNLVNLEIRDNDSVTTSQILRSTADAYVREGQTTNYGAATELQVKTGGGATRYTYLKFDLSSASAINTAKLRLYGKLNNTNASNVKTEIFSSGVTNWGETTVNYSNRPAVQTQKLGEMIVQNTTAQWYEIDLTAYLRSEKLAGRNIVTLVLINPLVSDPYTTFNSDEAASNRPELVVTS